jgi:release factor glutamine methyltransferase
MLHDALTTFRTRALVFVLRALTRPGVRRLEAGGRSLGVRVEAGVHDPAPLPGMSLLPLLAGAEFAAGEVVLELGTGAGAWALLAAVRGAHVTATERAGASLAPAMASAAEGGLAVRFRSGDLFDAVPDERFDVVCFNPPFHDGEPRPGEEAWVGGAVVRRFLAALPAALRPGGRAYVVLPRWEQATYAPELAGWSRRVVAARWFPLLGRVELLELRPGGAGRLPASAPALTWRRLGELDDIRSCELVSLAGRLDADTLARAVAWLPSQHPLLGARWDGPAWALGAAPLRLRVVHTEARDRDALIDHTWDDGLPNEVDVTLLRGPEHDWLRVRVPHDRTDARSGAQVVQDLADAYHALSRGEQPVLRPDPAPWEPGALFRPRLRDAWDALRRLARDLVAAPSFAYPPDAPRGRIHAAVHESPSETLAALKTNAASERTTVHALLLRAAGRAFGVHRMFDLVTLRPLATAPVDARSDVLVVPWVQTWRRGASEAEARAALAAQVAIVKGGGARAELARLRLYTSLADFVPTALAARLTTRIVVKTDVVVTNPGPVHVPLARFGDVPIADFVNFPRLPPPGRVALVFTTFRGRLRVIALWDDAAFPEGVEGQVRRVLAEATNAPGVALGEVSGEG